QPALLGSLPCVSCSQRLPGIPAPAYPESPCCLCADSEPAGWQRFYKPTVRSVFPSVHRLPPPAPLVPSPNKSGKFLRMRLSQKTSLLPPLSAGGNPAPLFQTLFWYSFPH